MLKRTHYLRGIFTLAIIMTITTPVMGSEKDAGQDWYCSDHETHMKYEKHLQQHLNKSAEAITETLAKIYSDSTLSTDEKKAQTIEVIDKYLTTKNIGVGD